MSLQCTIPLLYISAAVLCLLLHTSITLNNNLLDLFFVLHSYSLCAPCACNMHQAPACSPPPTVLHSGVFTHTSLFHNYPISCVPRCLSLFCISCSLSVLCLIIMVTLQLLWRFHPHASIITGCYLEIPQLLWQLRLFVFSVIDELILWQKPSFVSSSYTVKCNSSPPILFKFICTVELTSLNLAFISPFRTSAFRQSCCVASRLSKSRSLKL
jgi:hypothetical protein